MDFLFTTQYRFFELHNNMVDSTVFSLNFFYLTNDIILNNDLCVLFYPLQESIKIVSSYVFNLSRTFLANSHKRIKLVL